MLDKRLLEEEPLVSDVTGQPGITFDGAGLRHVAFAYGDELVLLVSHRASTVALADEVFRLEQGRMS